MGARNGDTVLVASLIARGLDVDAADHLGHTPLFAASWSGQEKMIAFLIERGAKVNYQGSDGRTALHAASEQGHIEAVKILLNSGADATMTTGAGGFTAADLAWSANHAAIVDLLESRKGR